MVCLSEITSPRQYGGLGPLGEGGGLLCHDTKRCWYREGCSCTQPHTCRSQSLTKIEVKMWINNIPSEGRETGVICTEYRPADSESDGPKDTRVGRGKYTEPTLNIS